MCGIAGVLSARPGATSDAELRQMGAALAHRGPDGDGLWLDSELRVGFAHRRLAIIDRSSAGAQPMSTSDGRFHITYNGEVYNHTELRAELESLGFSFRSRTDTEVVLNGYAAWGEALLPRLVGMFAFGIYDAEERRYVLVRDRVGVKPLYFHFGAGRLAFASEIKAILASGEVRAELDPAAAWHYLTFLTTPAPQTMFRDIYKLPAGSLLRGIAGAEPELVRWWDVGAAPPQDLDPSIYGDDDKASKELLRRLDRSIERRLMADVPVGVFLSGGIDSSANLALLSRHMDRAVDTFSVGFRDQPKYDELPWARQMAERFQTNHNEIVVDDVDAQEYMAELPRQIDEPLADWVVIPLHYLASKARASGVPVVHVGEGSDELFCGYDHFREPIDLHNRYQRPLGAMPGPIARSVLAAARFAGRFSSTWKRRAATADYIASGHEIFWGGAVLFRDGEQNNLWSGERPIRTGGPPFLPQSFLGYDSESVIRNVMKPFRSASPDAGFYQQMLYLELHYRLPELLLMRVDKVAMASSVEARVPFLDQDVVEFAMALPMHQRRRGRNGKVVLKNAVRGLIPDAVIDRKKVGFSAPFGAWLRGPFGKFVQARLDATELDLFDRARVRYMLDEHRDSRADHSQTLWALLNLTLWYDHWIADRTGV